MEKNQNKKTPAPIITSANLKNVKQDSSDYWEQLERLEKLIKSSELKSGLIFSFHSLILGLFVDRLEYFHELFEKNVVLLILCTMWVLCVLISIYYCFLCFMPRLELKYDSNVFFFRDAANSFGSVAEFSKKLIQVCSDEKELYWQLSQQIHVESKIIDQKFKSVHRSIKYFSLSFVIVIIFSIYWIISL